MIIVIKQNAGPERVRDFRAWLEARGLTVHISHANGTEIIGLTGDTDSLDEELLEGLDIVASVKRLSEPYKNTSRHFHPEDSVVDVSGVKIGGGHFAVIAGPCSVESREQIISVARSVKQSGAKLLRGGAFKPRTSPYDFQGLKADGLELLLEAKKAAGLPIVTEITDAGYLALYENVDLLQVGARNMQNFELLKELGRTGKPILLKRGLANTVRELLMAAEYIMAAGNDRIILCERGIRTFETATRNTLDISAVPVLHEKTHLPVIVDPSHGTGHAAYVKPMALASAAAGCDGLLIEVHNDPVHALSDGAQSLTPEQFADTMSRLTALKNALR